MQNDDKELVPCLASVMLKASLAPTATHSNTLFSSDSLHIRTDRPYIVINEQQWYWANIALKQKRLSAHTVPEATQFVLLQDMRGGEEGRMWVGASTNGLLVAIKFPHSAYYCDDEVVQELLQAELEAWKTLYGQYRPRIQRLLGRDALLMPYFAPIVDWSTVIAEGRPNAPPDGVLNQADVLRGVKAAVKHMAEAGYEHRDLHWGHVGVNASRQVALLNLSRLGRVDKENRAGAEQRMLAALGLSA